jgi:transposase-like protein
MLESGTQHQPSKQGSKGGRRRRLTAAEKYEVWLKRVTGELSQSEAAEAYGVDRSTIVRIRETAKAGAMAALADSKPGRPKNKIGPELAAARAEVDRLGEAVKEQAVEVVALRTKSRWG